MNREFGTIRDIFLRLHHKQKALWQSDGLSENVKGVYEMMIVNKRPMVDDQIIELMSDKSSAPRTDFCESKHFFYLPPLENNCEFIPLLTFECDFGSSPPQISLKVHMYCYEKTKGEIRVTGFRFEGPHDEKKGGHNYYHVQPIKRLVAGGTGADDGFSDWIHDTVPTIPLNSSCPVSLVLNVLISLYGGNVYREYLKGANINGDYLKPFRDILVFEDEEETAET